MIQRLSFRYLMQHILGVVKRNPLFLHEIEWKNNGFLFTTPNMLSRKWLSIIAINLIRISAPVIDINRCNIYIYIIYILFTSIICSFLTIF